MKLYVILGSIFAIIGIFIGSIFYIVKLKNQISDLTQQNLIQSKTIQENDNIIKNYEKDIKKIQASLKKLRQQKEQDIKELKDIDTIPIGNDKQEELLKSLIL